LAGVKFMNLSLQVMLLLFLILLLAIFVTLVFLKNLSKRQNSQKNFTEKLVQKLEKLSEGQQQLYGGLKNISDGQSAGQANILKHVESRLNEVQKSMSDNLSGSASQTARTLGELHERLTTIDKAQNNIEKLSGNVLTLQDILSNKQARGAFGEIQLNDIVSKALPSDSYTFQATLSNGKRVDCLVHLPNPPGPIAIDSKFPLEAYESLRSSGTPKSDSEGIRNFKNAVKAHIKAIAERYILEGETADGALMFIPSEAVYAELHSNFSTVVREGFASRVWIVSPTTCMATLNTMRAVLKDARMRAQAGKIRAELGLLHKDLDRLEARANNLNKHFELASKDVEAIRTSAYKASRRSNKLDRFEFDSQEMSNEVKLDKI